MHEESKYQAKIQTEKGPTDPIKAKRLEQKMGLNYRQCIGELIYALTICRIDISTAIITLSQHSHQPAEIHYRAVKQLFIYLYATKKEGLTYWRSKPRMDLPDKPLPTPISKAENLTKFRPTTDPLELYGSCDTTWASDRLTRRSMGGVVMMLAGAAVYYKTRLQPTIAQSSTEAEFTNMADAGKAALYLRWILMEIGILQPTPTPILADNHGAIKMANAHHPTRRTRHVEMKHFVILQWTEDEFITFVETKSDSNYSDSLSKPTGRTKFYEHTDILMGRKRPKYSLDLTTTTPESPRVNKLFCSTCNLNPLLDFVYGDTSTFKSLDSASAGRCESLVTSDRNNEISTSRMRELTLL
jgi:hypothetical protein